MGIEGNFFNLIKSIYRKRTAVTTLNGGRLCAVPELRTRQGGHAHAISTVLEVQPGQSQQEKKRHRLERKKSLSLFSDGITCLQRNIPRNLKTRTS